MKVRSFIALFIGLVTLPGGALRADDEVSESAIESVAEEIAGGDCCCHGGILGLLPGVIAPSDTCFSDFISPMTNPVFFEDPRTLTEARIIFLNHNVSAAAGGGDVQLYGMQVRAALNDRLSIVAAKDGYITSDNPLIRDGWADVAVGLKYNLLVDPCARKLISAGVSYELTSGSTRARQANGDGEFHIYLTGMKQVGCWHWISGSGFRIPTDGIEESQSWYWSNHIDRQIGCCGLYGFGEVNWYKWIDAGANPNGIAGVEGGDLFNFGSPASEGDIVTGAIGVKYKPCANREIGVAWETPLTDRQDILENRLTVDLILRY